MSDFNPKSTDAVFARILARLDQLDTNLTEHRVELNERLDGISRTVSGLDERVLDLEKDRWYQRGIVAAMSVGAAVAYEWVKSKWFK